MDHGVVCCAGFCLWVLLSVMVMSCYTRFFFGQEEWAGFEERRLALCGSKPDGWQS